MADWFIATEGVKIVKDSTSLWPQIITAVSSIGAALGGVGLTHHFTRRREERADAAKLESERLYISTELVFLLEKFAESCADVAADTGEDNNDPQPIREPTVDYPELSYQDVTGDWKVLQPRIMYRIRELPVLQSEARKAIAYVKEADFPGDYREYFRERRYQYARLGLKTIIQIRRLRKLAGFPETRLAATFWSAQPVLWEVWRIERRRRAKEAAEHRKLYGTERYEDSMG
jgi:hypothetical protein